MDYCVPCRRTLNGAVTCPECGAYDNGMAPLGDWGGGAAEVDTAAMEVSEGRDSAEPRGVPSSLTPSVPGASVTADVPEDRRHGSPRWKKHGVRTLAAADASPESYDKCQRLADRRPHTHHPWRASGMSEKNHSSSMCCATRAWGCRLRVGRLSQPACHYCSARSATHSALAIVESSRASKRLRVRLS